jgi:hypothetical protein
MAQAKRRYTTIDGQNDWIVTVAYDERAIPRSHWFEAQVSAKNERTGGEFKFPREIATYRIGEIEHTWAQIINLDFGGDREAALHHTLDSVYRRVYAYIERGH